MPGSTGCTITSWLVLLAVLGGLVLCCLLASCFNPSKRGEHFAGAADGEGAEASADYQMLAGAEEGGAGGGGGGGGGGGSAFDGAPFVPFVGSAGPYKPSTEPPLTLPGEGGHDEAAWGSADLGAINQQHQHQRSISQQQEEPAYVEVMRTTKARGSLEVGDSLGLSQDEARGVMDSEFNPADEGQVTMLAALSQSKSEEEEEGAEANRPASPAGQPSDPAANGAPERADALMK
jgi:hypothetical protein